MKGALPDHTSLIIGRQSEVESALLLLHHSDPPARLLTLTGPGGVGKTRLATQIAFEWQQANGNALYFVPFTSTTDPTLVPAVIAHALDIHDTGSLPVAEALKDFLREKHVLLIIDSFEHLKPATPFIADLLSAAQRLRLLVTSRTPLHLPDEVEFIVPPLVVPDLDNLPSAYLLSNYAAVSLFIQRARQTEPNFGLTPTNAAAVAEICVHLDGLPLAIELAAARIKSILPDLMRERLYSRLMLLIGDKNLPPRHQTLRAAIDWSHDLLTRAERALFARIAVFTGSANEECIKAICNLEGDLPEIDATLRVLVDQSLLRVVRFGNERRYEMLETIREYALEQLAERGETLEMRRRHADHFLEMAEYAETRLRGPEQKYWLNRLEADFDNLRAAIGRALDSDEPELGLRIAGSLNWFWSVHGHANEGREWLNRLFAKPGRSLARAKALSVAAFLALPHGDFDNAEALYTESLSISQELEDSQGAAAAWYGLGRVAANLSNYAEARALYEKSLETFRELDDPHSISDVLINLGRIASDLGDYAQTRSFYEQSLTLRRASGDQWGIARALESLAYLTADTCQYAEARALTAECLAIYRDLGDRNQTASMLFNLGYIVAEQGDYALAGSFYQEASVIWGETGKRIHLAGVHRQWSYLAAATGDPALAQAYAEKSVSLCRELGIKWGLIRALVSLGVALREQNRLDEAGARLDESLALAREINDRIGMGIVLKEQGAIALRRVDLPQAADVFGKSLSLLKPATDQRAIIECLEGLADLTSIADHIRATRLWASADSARRSLGLPLEPAKRPEQERRQAEARSQLGDAPFNAAWQAGKALTLQEAIALAFETLTQNP